jgi:hypothetical protein
MSAWTIAGGIYIVVAVAALGVTRILSVFWRNVFLDVFPMMIKGFWDVYPGRKWPGPLKVIGYPTTIVFLLTVAMIFISFDLLMLLAISPKAIWWAAQRISGRNNGGPPDLPPAVASKMRATG